MPNMLTRQFVEQLHLRMYGDVWEWAGTQRQVDTNIGVPFSHIGVALRELFDDARYWLDHRTYEPMEFAVRLHHRLVFIHPFPNGNGRLSRFYADLALTRHFGLNRLTWGGGELDGRDPRRQDYIAALQAADDHAYRSLLAFAQT